MGFAARLISRRFRRVRIIGREPSEKPFQNASHDLPSKCAAYFNVFQKAGNRNLQISE
jgi:hypothetical protein